MMNFGSLFAGIGGFDLGLERAGMVCKWQVEIDPFCNKVLAKHWPNVRRFGDVREVHGVNPHTNGNGLQEPGTKLQTNRDRQLYEANKLEPVDLICGGFPCQPFSCAGKRKGTQDNRFLWGEMFRIISDVKPTWVVAENVRGLLSIEGGMVFENCIADLESIGYEVQALVIPACAVQAPHRRDRVWIVGNAGRTRLQGDKGRLERTEAVTTRSNRHASDTEISRWDSKTQPENGNKEMGQQWRCGLVNSINEINGKWDEPWIEVASEFCGIFDGLSDWIHRHYNKIISEVDYEGATQKDRTEGVSILREAIQSEKIWEDMGRILQIPEKEILLTLLLYFQEEPVKKSKQMESKEMDEINRLRNLWNKSGFKCSPQRFELHEQRGKELTNIVPELSFPTARILAKIADYIICGESTMNNKHRVDRLKCLGNAVVPQIVEILGRAILEVEDNHDPKN